MVLEVTLLLVCVGVQGVYRVLIYIDYNLNKTKFCVNEFENFSDRKGRKLIVL